MSDAYWVEFLTKIIKVNISENGEKTHDVLRKDSAG